MDELLRLLDDARAEARGEARQRERHLRRAAEEGARLAGTLLDLAEQGSAVTIRTTTGRSHHGVVRLVASDFVVLDGVWLTHGAIATVRPPAGERHAAAVGARSPAVDLLLVEALGRIVGERPQIAVVTEGGDAVVGELRAVGADVLTLRLDGSPGSVCYVASSSVREVLRSG